MSATPVAAPSDRKAAYTGLIVGAVLVFAILYGVVKLTNAQFAAEHGEHGATAAPEATK